MSQSLEIQKAQLEACRMLSHHKFQIKCKGCEKPHFDLIIRNLSHQEVS